LGTVLKIIGFVLVLAGVYGLFITIPNILLNIAVDQINPLVILGFVESGVTPQIFDLILSIALIGFGIIMIKVPDRSKVIPR